MSEHPNLQRMRLAYEAFDKGDLAALDEFWRQAPPPDPRLANAFLRGIAACLQLRGVGFAQPGRAATVAGVVRRLHLNLLNQPLDKEGRPLAQG